MGSFEIFCLLCQGPFRIDDPFNEIHRRRVKARRGRGASGMGPPVGIGYSRKLISEEDFKWAEKVQILGFNPQGGKCFITGIGDGNTQECGMVECAIGTDENVPPEDELYSNNDGNSDGESLDETEIRHFDVASNPYYPFHPACFQIFAQALKYLRTGQVMGLADTTVVEKDMFYAALNIFHLRGVKVKEKKLDFGELSDAWSNEQYWECKPSEEPWVTNPVESPQISTFMSALQNPSTTPSRTDTTPLQSHRTPFNKLADEIIHEILLYLPHTDFKSLIRTGLISPNLPRVQSFWKRKLFLEMPFLFDFPSEPQQRDWFTTYRELRRHCFATIRRTWKDVNGYLEVVVKDRDRELVLGLTNRRRVWRACEQVAEAYLREEESGVKKVLPVGTPNTLKLANNRKNIGV